jgi:hypothetical protein
LEHKVSTEVPDGNSKYDPGVVRILSESIDSFEKLEVAVHLFRARFGAQTTAEVAKTLKLPHDATAEALSELTQAHVLRTTDQDGAAWCFDPTGPWAADLEKLATLYEQERLDVVNLMARLAVERIRTHAARMFADAFLIKAPKPGKKGDSDA